MQEQPDTVEQVENELPVWESPELVKVDLSSGTLGGNTGAADLGTSS